jgi:glucose-1-phosphate thymidylyltransferase
MSRRPLTDPLIGLIPAAGRASRAGLLPCSKEVWPVGFAPQEPPRPIVAVDFLLGGMAEAGVPRACVVLRRGKWDIPTYLSARAEPPDLAHVVTGATSGVPASMDQAYPWIRDHTVVFGFPDIIFRAAGVFPALLDELAAGGTDVALSLFPAADPRKMDMLELGPGDSIREIVIKPERTDLRWTWIHAAWTAGFTEFLHEFVARDHAAATPAAHAGDVLRAAIAEGLKVSGLRFEDGEYLDIGTPGDLAAAERTTRAWGA